MAALESIHVEDIVKAYGPLPPRPELRAGKTETLYGTEGVAADHYFCLYPTGVVVMGVTRFHPLVQEGQIFLDLPSSESDGKIQIKLEKEEHWSVADRGQKARIPNFTDHVMCTIHVGEKRFPIHHPFRTALLNFNPRLNTQPEMLVKRYRFTSVVRERVWCGGVIGKDTSQFLMQVIEPLNK